MKILLDTNVLIAAFIARGLCHELVEHCVRQHTLFTSDFIIGELREKLTNKFKYSSADTEKAVALLLTKMIVVAPVDLGNAVCRDPDDDNVLATAVAGNCDCLITGDKDLLILKLYAGIDILSPSEFLDYEESKTR